MSKELTHRFHAALVRGLFAFSRALPLDVASGLGGFLGRTLGPRVASSAQRAAIANLKLIFPDMGEDERNALLSRMWDNLGRTAAELPHLPSGKLYARVKVGGAEHFPPEGKNTLFFSAHYGNWELAGPMAHNHGVPLSVIYRHANNPIVDKLIADIRGTQCVSLFPKGPRGAVKMAHALKKGISMAMLIDQKMNDGIAVPFFGYDAMTAPAIAMLALRYDLPIIPARVVRTHGAHFEGTVFPPLAYEKTGDNEKDILAIMTAINKMLEDWIRQHPEQWFWVHRRWPKELFQ